MPVRFIPVSVGRVMAVLLAVALVDRSAAAGDLGAGLPDIACGDRGGGRAVAVHVFTINRGRFLRSHIAGGNELRSSGSEPDFLVQNAAYELAMTREGDRVGD